VPSLVLFSWIVWLFGTSRQFGDCIRNRKEYEAYQSLHEEPFFIVKLFVRLHLNSVCAAHTADAYSGAITALAGVAVAVFTFTLWRTTGEQARLTRVSIDLGNKEFFSSHRPRIVVRGIGAIPPPSKTSDTRIRYLISNNGDGVAHIVRADFYIACKHDHGMIWPFVKGQSPNLPQTIDSGYNIHGECIVSAEMAEILWDAKEVKAISTMKRDITLIFRVTIAYEDTIGRRRQTSAYREYDFATERFRRVEDSEFEYQD